MYYDSDLILFDLGAEYMFDYLDEGNSVTKTKDGLWIHEVTDPSCGFYADDGNVIFLQKASQRGIGTCDCAFIRTRKSWWLFDEVNGLSHLGDDRSELAYTLRGIIDSYEDSEGSDPYDYSWAEEQDIKDMKELLKELER